MCQHARFIMNRYDGRSYFVNCGHCPACLQEKSNIHVARINLESKVGKLPVFVTLSYENDFIPFILHSELKQFVDLPLERTLNVYRNNDIIKTLSYEDFLNREKFHSFILDDALKYLRYKRNDGTYGLLNDRIGVLNFRDLQLFIKRLKINIFRRGYRGYFSYYYASEYGEKFCRPHFHLLFFIDKEFYEEFKFALNSCWPYADLLKWRKQYNGVYRQSVEVAKNPAKYVSSYVNCRSYVPRILSESKPFSPFRRFSLHFGCNLAQFSLPKILQKVHEGNLRYVAEVHRNGVSTFSNFKIPRFVLSRYFPKFKGYRYLSANEIILYLQRPSCIFFNKKLVSVYSDVDLNDIYNTLCCINKRSKNYGPYYFDWLHCYPSALSLFSSESLKNSYDEVKSIDDLFYHFDNIKDYYLGDIQNHYLMQFDLPSNVLLDANDFPARRAKTLMLEREYHLSTKHHQIKSSYYEESTF